MKTLLIAALTGAVASLVACDFVASSLVDASADVDPQTVNQDFEDTFGVTAPEGYKGGLSFRIRVLGREKKLVSLIPERARPEEIFEGGASLKFNPGPYTIAVGVTLDLGHKPEELKRSFQRFVAENGDGSDFSRVFVESGHKKLAAYEHVGTNYGQTNLSYYFLLDGGELVLVSGPEGNFDHSFKDAMAAGLTASHPANAFLYSHLSAPARDPHHPCGFPSLPARFDVHAIGVARGTEKLEGSAIDPTDDELYAQPVVVGSTPHPVVLVLMGGRPMVWRVSMSAEAKLAGVLATGRGVQRVIGLPEEVPLNEVVPRDPNGCRPFYADEDDWERGEAQNRIWDALAQDAKQFHARHAGASFQVGKVTSPPRTDSSRQLEDVLLDPARQLLPGKLGLRQLEGRGIIRPATKADLARWVEVAGAGGHSSEELERFRRSTGADFERGRGYLIARDTQLPLGMAGANSARFVVAKGVRDVTGDIGHNTILYPDGRCVGPACP